MEDKTVKVVARIMGEDYTIRGRAPQEHIERIARYVDGKMAQISETYPKLGTSRVAVLAAINMADELFKIKEQYEQLTQLLEEEWSQRHGPGDPAEEPPARAPAHPGRLPGGPATVKHGGLAAREAAVAADRPAGPARAGQPGEGRPCLPGQVQLTAFGEPAADPEELLTGDAGPVRLPASQSPEDEDQ